jgi:hypothetical protein
MCALLWIYGFGGAWDVLCGYFSLICAAVGFLLSSGTERGVSLSRNHSFNSLCRAFYTRPYFNSIAALRIVANKFALPCTQ